VNCYFGIVGKASYTFGYEYDGVFALCGCCCSISNCDGSIKFKACS